MAAGPTFFKTITLVLHDIGQALLVRRCCRLGGPNMISSVLTIFNVCLGS